MNIKASQLEALQALGYTEAEARFNANRTGTGSSSRRLA
jgi:Holliday junction resolvasome RuvABC DNA-binding subunit